MIVAYSYYQEIDSPANKDFVKPSSRPSGRRRRALSERAVPRGPTKLVYLWAEGVKKANSTDRMAVIEALEALLPSMTGRAASSQVEPKTHHCGSERLSGRAAGTRSSTS